MVFCLALVPLTRGMGELATSGYGYKISNISASIDNLFYIDDLKLNRKNKQEKVGELKIVKQFSDENGLIDVETAFKTETTGLDYYLRDKEGQYPKAGA